MYICVCNAITQDMLETAVKQGQSEKDVMKKLGVGNSCGICLLEHVQAGLAKKNQRSEELKKSSLTPKK